MRSLEDKIDAVLRSTASISVRGVKFEFRAPSVEQYLKMRKEQLEIKKDESYNETEKSLRSSVALVKSCMVDSEGLDDDTIFRFLIGLNDDESQPIFETVQRIFYANTYPQVDEETGEEATLEEKVEEETDVPLS